MGWLGRLFGGGGAEGVERVDGEKARRILDEGGVLVDVRSPGEYAGGHLPDAINIPVDAIGARAGELDPDKPVVLYCRSGARSASAGKQLAAKGFDKVYDLGGMGRW